MRLNFSMNDDFSIKLSKLANEAESIAKEAVYAGAAIAADEIRSRAKEVLSGESSGEMMESFGIAPIESNENDEVNTSVGFDGYDSKGVANQLKARTLESGTSKIKKRPFVRPSINATREEIEKAMAYVIDMKTTRILK